MPGLYALPRNPANRKPARNFLNILLMICYLGNWFPYHFFLKSPLEKNFSIRQYR